MLVISGPSEFLTCYPAQFQTTRTWKANNAVVRPVEMEGHNHNKRALNKKNCRSTLTFMAAKIVPI